MYNDSANLVKPFSLFLRQISAALHAKGHKLSQCVGLYPTRDGGASMFYDPAVVGETVDTVRVMNYDMCKRDLPRLLSRAAHAGANRLPDRSPLNPQIMARG